MKQTNLIIIGVVALIIGGAGGFIGGMQYQKMQANTPSNQLAARSADGTPRQFGNGQRGPGGTFRGGAVTGEILSADDTSLTVKLADGSSKIVLLTATTTISKASTGSKTDLATAAKVAVFGTPNSDGSVTAQSIQINPMVRFGIQNNSQQK